MRIEHGEPIPPTSLGHRVKHRFTARPRPSVQTCVRRAILAAAALVAAAMPVAGVMAQTSGSYPNKPVHILVGFPAGGPVDTLARAIGQKLSESMGQPVGSVIRSLRLFESRQNAGCTVDSSGQGIQLRNTSSAIPSNFSFTARHVGICRSRVR